MPTYFAHAKGTRPDEHLFTLRQSFEAWRYHEELIAECNEEINRQIKKIDGHSLEKVPKHNKQKKSLDEPIRQHLFEKLGTDFTAVPGISIQTAQIFLSEVGSDLSKFPTVDHFASWLTVPG